MAIPKYDEMYNIFLESIKDGKEHVISDVRDAVIQFFNLSEDDIEEMLPSGRQRVLYNRVGWSREYLLKAKCISSPARAKVLITERGLELLEEDNFISNDTLSRYPEFRDFVNRKLKQKKTDQDVENQPSARDASVEQPEVNDTPREILERAYDELNNALADELLTEIRKMDLYKFEVLVVDLLIKMGYGKLQYGSGATQKSRDGGIDGVVTADKLGFDSIYIQAKRFKEDSPVGRPEVQRFAGALLTEKAQKGIFITTSIFSKSAEEFVEKNSNQKIVLIDGERLSELMIEYELGVSTEYVYKVRRLDSDYFEGE